VQSGEKGSGSVLVRLVEGLGQTEREALRLIAAGDSRAYHEWTGKNRIMGELVCDRINEAFRELHDDLLIETLDEGPVIQGEYREELDLLFRAPK
jgi:hypothetical protein